MNTDQASVSPGLGRKILLVDDDHIQRKAVKMRLELAGFVVSTAESATRALRVAAGDPPDAIVSDVLMDDVDGFSLCRSLRQEPSLTAVPIVLVSAYFDETADRALAREVGANALVQRSPSMQACVETLVRSLAEGPSKSAVDDAQELYENRLAHRLYRMRDETRHAEERFQALFEHANDAVSLVTPDGIVLDVNRRWEQITGRPREELVGLRVRDFAAGNTDAAEAEYREVAAKNQDRSGPVPIRAADGGVLLMEFTTATIDVDGAQRVLAIGRDVTEVVESRKRLEASEQRYRSLVENVPDVFWSTDANLDVSFVSSNIQKLSGYSQEEVLADGAGIGVGRIHPDDIAQLRMAVDEVLARRMPLDQEFRWQHQNGRWLWLHCRAARVTAPDGSERLEGICTDVTTRKSLEEQLSRSQKIEAIGQLTAGIAHDFNNLLSVILAGAEHLESRLGGEDKQVSQEICDATLRGVELTSRLLGFARKRARSSRATDLNVVLEELTPMLARAAGRDVTLSVVPFVGLGAICADRGELEQILMNLAINARDAMPRGGQLTVETLNVDVSLAEARENGKPGAGKHVAIRVSDTGSGMDQDTLSHLFEPFFTTKAEKGTGLGLSTSYGIVRRHGGHIVVESSLGKGTMFTVYFPRLTDAQRDRATSACA